MSAHGIVKLPGHDVDLRSAAPLGLDLAVVINNVPEVLRVFQRVLVSLCEQAVEGAIVQRAEIRRRQPWEREGEPAVAAPQRRRLSLIKASFSRKRIQMIGRTPEAILR